MHVPLPFLLCFFYGILRIGRTDLGWVSVLCVCLLETCSVYFQIFLKYVVMIIYSLVFMQFKSFEFKIHCAVHCVRPTTAHTCHKQRTFKTSSQTRTFPAGSSKLRRLMRRDITTNPNMTSCDLQAFKHIKYLSSWQHNEEKTQRLHGREARKRTILC